jgi:hypothetical protein
MAAAMGMKANLLPEISLANTEKGNVASANTGGDVLTSNHVRNWMECVRSRKAAQCTGGSRVQSFHSQYHDQCRRTYRLKATFDEKHPGSNGKWQSV